MPSCAGATRLVHRYSTGSRSPGVVARMARNALASRLVMARRLLSSAMDCAHRSGLRS